MRKMPAFLRNQKQSAEKQLSVSPQTVFDPCLPAVPNFLFLLYNHSRLPVAEQCHLCEEDHTEDQLLQLGRDHQHDEAA